MSIAAMIFFAVMFAMKWADASDYRRKLIRANGEIDDLNKRINYLCDSLKGERKAKP